MMDGSGMADGPGSNDVTVDVALAGSHAEPAHHVQLVEGSGPALSGETLALLRSRLRAASLILFMGFAVFLCWRLLSLAFGIQTAAVRTDAPILIAHAAVTALLGVFAFSLCRSCPLSERILRMKELLVFAIPACYLMFVQYGEMVSCAANDRYLPNPVGAWLMLIFTYAMFIPNTWRRAAAVIGTLAAVPVLVCVYLWRTDDFCCQFLHGHAWFLVEVALVMLVSAVGSTIGVRTINTLRHEAFEAKRLGQYRLRHRIGGGGKGEVYLAEHQMMKRPCAIKLIRPEKAGDPQVLARFEQEVRASAKLSHWNNIDIFDYGRAACGTFYYVMEYLPGLNLGDLVQRSGPLPAGRVIHLLGQVCAALSEAHAAGLIHRDIKPANVFAAKRGGLYDVAKLLDFGLVKPLIRTDSVQLTQEGSIAGSPLFMSPEQATGDQEPDERSDIYSLGVLAYFLLAGRAPFVDQRPIKVLFAHAHESPVPLSQVQSDVPADLEKVVMRCLAKRPDDRWPSAADLGAALDQCASAGSWTQEMAVRWWRDHASAETQPLPVAVG